MKISATELRGGCPGERLTKEKEWTESIVVRKKHVGSGKEKTTGLLGGLLKWEVKKRQYNDVGEMT